MRASLSLSTVQIHDLTHTIDDMVKQVETDDHQFVIERQHQPVARLMSETFLHNLISVIDLQNLSQKHPALADTLALMMNNEVQQQIEADRVEWNAGYARPFQQLVDEIHTADRT